MHLLELRGFELSLRVSRRRYLCVLHFLLKHRENNWDRHHPAPEGVQIGTGGSRQILYCTRLNQFSLLVFFTQHEGTNRENKRHQAAISTTRRPTRSVSENNLNSPLPKTMGCLNVN